MLISESDGFRATAFRSMQEEDGVGEYIFTRTFILDTYIQYINYS
jgi:hypothetical protein